MPVPQPKIDENESQFVGRCISFMKKEIPPQPDDQIQAICLNTWRTAHEEAMHPDFQAVLQRFIKTYGPDNGRAKFQEFIQKNNLDPSKGYNPKAQWEAVAWPAPLIEYYSSDPSAKYYQVLALTASMTFNKRDYGPEEKLEKAGVSMNWRPLNLNHNQRGFLPFPTCRVDYASVDEMGLKCIVRIDNSQPQIQRMLEDGRINTVSVEAREIPAELGGGYHFLALSLLERGKQLPADPVANIEPLFLHESVKLSLAQGLTVFCKVSGDKIVCRPPAETVESLREALHEKDETIKQLRHQAARIQKASKTMRKIFVNQEGMVKINARTGKLIPFTEDSQE